jgi:hypothetical protein
MTGFVWIAIGALALYLLLRVVQMKRRSLPFIVAYPVFVLVFVGGGIAIFVGASHTAVVLRLGHEVALAFVYGLTLLALFPLWRIARRLIS